MRIALVHSYYRSDSPSGESLVVDSQRQLLEAAGHVVHIEGAFTDDLQSGAAYQARTAWNVATGAGIDPGPGLRRFRPDVVHVHNLFPNFGTRWLKQWQGPLVATLHNYRPLCVKATLERDGHLCLDCPQGNTRSALRHRCYRDSTIATLPLYLRNQGGLAKNPLFQRADALITLSETALETYQRYGADAKRTVLIPNGVAAAGSPPGHPEEPEGWVYVGRLSPEKGLLDLLRMWPADQSLDVIGDGPQIEEVRRAAGSGVSFLGRLPPDSVKARLSDYLGMIFPGTNLEGAYPLAAVEAMSAGLPIVAASRGAGARLVSEHSCGAVYSDRDSLVSGLQKVSDERAFLSEAGRTAWAAGFTPERWRDALLALYGSLIAP